MPEPLQLDVVVPTYNRERLLAKTLHSFAAARTVPGLRIRIVVVDNNSSDGTASMVQGLAASFPLPLTHLHEARQSSSHTRNAGIAASTADLVGFVDDDEEIEPDWFEVVAREFSDPAVEFIGGPYLANWVTAVPEWLPQGYHAVIGAVPPRPRSPVDSSFGAILMGGNAVFRRAVFARVGLYSTELGRGARGLLSEEDADMQRRLQAAGLFGMYVPELRIRHYIAPERLTRGYHRRWVYWRGVSQGVQDRRHPDTTIPYLCGVPRYRIGEALRGLLRSPIERLRGRPSEAFRLQLPACDLAGFVYGKYLLKVSSLYQPASPHAKVAKK